MQEFFRSEVTKDEIFILLIRKSHKAIFKLKVVDDASEHINLINKLNAFLKKDDIKWVELPIDFIPKIPSNTISYTNKFNGNFVCHVEDFEKFYLANFHNLIKYDHIYCNPDRVAQDGWIKVTGIKKEKKDKYVTIIKELQELIGDWNSL